MTQDNGKKKSSINELSVESFENSILRGYDRIRLYESLEKLDTKYWNYIINNAQKRIAAGHLRIEGNQLQLTRQGIFVSDDVMSDLIWI